MTKFTQSDREEIERIKQEYYCGSARALQVYRKVSHARKFADLVNERLEKLDASVPYLTWQLGECVRADLLMQRNIDSLEGRVDGEGYISKSDGQEKRAEDDSAEETDAKDAKRQWTRMLNLQFGAQDWVVDLVAKHYQNLAGEGGLDYERVYESAKRIDEISFSGFHHDELVSLDVVADDRKRDVPVYMAGGSCDSIYVRMKEEGTLGVAALQQTFLLAFAGAARAKSVDDLREFFRAKYEEGQTSDHAAAAREDEQDLVPLFEEHSRLMCEAADYGLGLLRRSDLSGWLRKYFGS